MNAESNAMATGLDTASGATVEVSCRLCEFTINKEVLTAEALEEFRKTTMRHIMIHPTVSATFSVKLVLTDEGSDEGEVDDNR